MPKRFADVLINGSYQRVKIWDMIRLIENNPEKYESIKSHIYSTHKKTENKKPMTFVSKNPPYKSFFRYKSNIEHYPTGEGFEESATHEAYKDLVADLKELNLYIYGKKVILFITRSEIECKIDLNGHRYLTDAFFWFKESIPHYYVAKWGGQLAFEIQYTHPVGNIKKHDFVENGIALFEHSISKKLCLEDSTSEEQEKREIDFIKSNYLSKVIYGELLSDPESEEYKEMKELEELQNKIVLLQKQVEERNKAIENYKEQLEDRDIQIKKQENELFVLSGKLLGSEKELDRIKNTIRYKLFIRK